MSMQKARIPQGYHDPIRPTVLDEFMMSASQLIEQLSSSHICEILTLEKPEERLQQEIQW